MILSAETTKPTKLIQTHYIARVFSKSFQFGSSTHIFEDIQTLLASCKSGSGEEKYKRV